MGYYTQFDITNNSEEVRSTIESVSEYTFSYGELHAKWYDWQRDVKLVSTMFPDTEICVEGIGEENEDVWKAFAKDGELHISKATLTFGPYVKA